MKKLLILLIGFAFTQSIQTRQIEVTISDFQSEINLYETFGLTGEQYQVKPIKFETSNMTFICESIDDFNANSGGFGYIDDFRIYFTDEYTADYSDTTFPISSHLTTNCGNNHIYPYTTSMYISNSLPNITINANCFNGDMSCLLYPLLENITFTFWVTGMFEDEAFGTQGDLNNDDIVDVIDIVALVNLILGEE